MRSGAIYCWLLRFMCYSDSTKAESPQVINVIVPNQRHHFLLPLGYILTSFLLLVFIILIIVLITHRHKSKGLERLLYQNIELTYKYMLILSVLLSFQCFIRSRPRGERHHTNTHTSAPRKHTLRRVFLLLRQVWEKSLQLGAFWDGFCWGDRVQPGGQKHRWGTNPPEREGQVCPHCSFKFTVCGVFPDYKNNLLKEKAHLSSPPKVIDLDKGNSYLSACLHMEQTIILI